MPLSYVQIDNIYSENGEEWCFSETGFPVNTIEIHTFIDGMRASLESCDNGNTFVPSYGTNNLSERAIPYDEACKIMANIGIIPPACKQIGEKVGGATETLFYGSKPVHESKLKFFGLPEFLRHCS